LHPELARLRMTMLVRDEMRHHLADEQRERAHRNVVRQTE
jgi:hypothetical protein